MLQIDNLRALRLDTVWRSIQNVLSGEKEKSGLILEQATGEKRLTFVLSHYPSYHLQICPNSFRAECYYSGFSGVVLGTENSEIRGYGRWVWRTGGFSGEDVG